MSLSNLKVYPRVVLLFGDHEYITYTPGSLASIRDVSNAQMVIAFEENGTTKILKNRWGYPTV
jgi:hypothetical protein